MSQRNMERVRRIYADGLFDRDPDRIVREFATSDIEYINPPEAVEPGIRRGRARVAQALRDSSELFDSSRHELHELYECGDSVVALVSFRTRSRGSGLELVQQEAHTWTFRDGMIARFEWGRDVGAALEAAQRRDSAKSQGNVQLARRAYDALNRRDLDGFLELMAADVEARPRVVAIEGGYHGHDGIRRWWGQLVEFLPDVAIETVAVRDLSDLTLAAVHMRGHGAGSNTPLDEALWSAADWRDRKCVWWGNYETEAEALAAVALRQ